MLYPHINIMMLSQELTSSMLPMIIHTEWKPRLIKAMYFMQRNYKMLFTNIQELNLKVAC